jgi:hypothetical protein
VSIRRIHVLVLACCFLLACQSRTVVTRVSPTPTPEPLVPATPAVTSSAPSRIGGTGIATSTAASSPVAAATQGAGTVASAVPTSPPGAASPPAVASAPTPAPCLYGGSKRLVEVQERALKEASALAASQHYPGVYWTLNDSGNSPTVYAVDEQGRSRGTFRVDDAENVDWESMAVGPGKDGNAALYIGDTGDNDSERRDIVIYRVPEPEPIQAGARNTNGRTDQAEAFKLQYPNGPRDTEALLVHPKTGEILLVTKEVPGRTTVYRVPLPLDSRRTVKLERITEVDMARAGVKIDVVNDAAVSADASRVVIRTYGTALEYDVPAGAALASIWEQVPRASRLTDGPQGEGITYRLDGKALITIGESSPTYLYETARQC